MAKKIFRLTESDLVRLVKKVINEEVGFDLKSILNKYDLTQLLTGLGFQQGIRKLESNFPRGKNKFVAMVDKRKIQDSDIFSMSGGLVVFKDKNLYYVSGLPKMKYQVSLWDRQKAKTGISFKDDFGRELNFEGYYPDTLKYVIVMGTIGEQKLKEQTYSPLINKLLIDKGYISGTQIGRYERENLKLFQSIQSELRKNYIKDMNSVYFGVVKNTVITIIQKTDRGYEVIKDDYRLITDRVPKEITVSELYKKLST